MLVSKPSKKPLARLTQVVVFSSIFSSSSLLHAYEYIEEGSLSDEDSIIAAIEKGETSLDFRFRYENARQPTVPKQDAQAATLRTRVGYQTQRYNLLSAYVQFDDVSAIPNDEDYNSGSNRQFDDVLIGEPDDTRLSQAWLNYDVANTSLTYGRQSYSLNSGRMLGGDDWYQNEQVFTGLSISNQSLNYITFSYADFNEVEHAYSKFGGRADSSLNARLFDIHYRGFLLNDLSVYHLSISDYDNDSNWETKTTGIYFSGIAGGNNGNRDSNGSLEGNDFSLSYQFEFAQQKDAGSNRLDYKANYLRFEVGAAYQNLGATIVHEKLGSDGSASFVTPLASLHNFQGSTGQAVDDALGNVAGGIVDKSITFSYRSSEKFLASITYHHFEYDEAPSADNNIGSEYEASFRAQFERYSFVVKYADYLADQVGEDTRRVWLQAGLNL